MAWTAPATAVAGSVLTAAWLNTYLRDNMLAIQAGLVALVKLTFAGSGSNPSTSSAGEAVIAYNTTRGELVASLDGDAYERLGAKQPYADPLVAGGTVLGFRY